MDQSFYLSNGQTAEQDKSMAPVFNKATYQLLVIATKV